MSHHSLRITVGFVILVLFTVSCATTAAGPTSLPTTDPATPAAETAAAVSGSATASAKSTADAKSTEDAKAAAQATEDAKATADAQATFEAGATSTEIAKLTATQVSAETTSTAQAAAQLTRTAEAFTRATAQAQPMAGLVQQLAKDGYLTGTEGTYTRLKDFSETAAQINYIFSFETPYSPKDFVLKSDMAWESASNTANWFNSACGFIFHIGEDGSYYTASLALDGRVYLGRHQPGSHYVDKLGSWFYGKVDIPKGSAKIVLLVTGDQITIFINDKMVHSYKSELKYRSGWLAYSITSGTNKDFGTRCTLTNNDLWELK